MTETAAEVVTDILQELVVQGAEQPLTADETQTVMRYMNRYMSMIAADGTNLGYTLVSDLGDTITIADGAIMGLVKNVARFIAGQFGIPVSMDLGSQADESYRTMVRLGTSIIATSMPCTLPIGSGNEVDGLNNDFHFFPCPDEDILTENNQNILLEANN
jgi:hypothetical protein